MYRHHFPPVLVLILGATMSGLVLSCGNGGTTDNCAKYVAGVYEPVPCSIYAPPLGPHLKSIEVCAGAPASPTVKPSATPTGANPSPTPTHTPCPTPAATTAMIPNPVDLNATGLFKNGTQTFYRDITSGAVWFADNNNLSYTQNGQFTTSNSGCTCVYASSGGKVSNPMGVAIAPNGGSLPICSPCPAAATPAATPAAALDSSPGSPARTGKVMWRFDAHAAVQGQIVAASSGGAVYFITADRRLHAINSAGREIFVRSAAGTSPAVGADGTIYAEGARGGLMALDAGGKLRWFAELGGGAGPLAVGPDNTVYDATDSELVAVAANGATKWQISMPGVRQVALSPDGMLIAVTDGGLTTLSSDGVIQWTFAPPAGIAGAVAIEGSALYVASPDNSLYALDLAAGNELWHRAAAGGGKTGVTVDGTGKLYVGGDAALAAFDVAGARDWSSSGFTPESVAPAVSSSGTAFVAAQGGHLAAIGPAGQLLWVAGNFGHVRSMTFSSADTLYVLSSDGTCWSLKEIIANN